RLLLTIEELFKAQNLPILLILEDMQWAGSESLGVLMRLSRTIQNLPVMVVASYRDDELPDLARKIPDAEVLKLHRLNESNIASLCQSMLGESGNSAHLIDRLERETEGNAFFLVEVMRMLAEEAGQLDLIGEMTLPGKVFTGGIQRFIQRRLDKVL